MSAYTSNAMVQYIHDTKTPGSLLVRQLPKMRKARKKHKMFAHNNKIFVLGGQASSVEVFDIIIEEWTLYEGGHNTGHTKPSKQLKPGREKTNDYIWTQTWQFYFCCACFYHGWLWLQFLKCVNEYMLDGEPDWMQYQYMLYGGDTH